MKTLLRVFVVLFVVGVMGYILGSALASHAGTETDAAMQKPKDVPIKPVMIFDPKTSGEWSDEFGGRGAVEDIITEVRKKCAAVSKPGVLDPAKIELIVDIYGDNGSLTGHDGHTYQGRREISRYLYRVLRGGHKITDFNIYMAAVYATELKHMIEMPLVKQKNEDFVHVLYFVFAGSYMMDVNLIDPPGSSTYGHRRVCEGDPDN